jgi:hypothetical protein
MATSSSTDSDVTEFFSNSESDGQFDTDSSGDFDEESNSEDEKQNTKRSFRERTWRVEWFEPKTFTFDSSKSGIKSYLLKTVENRPVDYFHKIFDHSLMRKVVEETNKYHFYTLEHENLPERYQEAIDTTVPEMYTFFAIYMLMAHIKKKSNERLLVY